MHLAALRNNPAGVYVRTKKSRKPIQCDVFHSGTSAKNEFCCIAVDKTPLSTVTILALCMGHYVGVAMIKRVIVAIADGLMEVI